MATDRYERLRNNPQRRELAERVQQYLAEHPPPPELSGDIAWLYECPLCHSTLRYSDSGLHCADCNRSFPWPE